ncbi:MAG TPA: ribosome-recycling factor, partial [Acidobacteriota bacterium]|nr:ribosome-recycling factor [Acidobacteriota bacterium]
DEERRALDEIQKLTDEYIEKIDELSRLKEAEILQG